MLISRMASTRSIREIVTRGGIISRGIAVARVAVVPAAVPRSTAAYRQHPAIQYPAREVCP